MQCFVYRSCRKEQTYVYLREQDAGATLPEAVRSMLGKLDFVMELELTPQSRLAREDAQMVLGNLRSSGFHVQFAPDAQHTTQ